MTNSSYVLLTHTQLSVLGAVHQATVATVISSYKISSTAHTRWVLLMKVTNSTIVTHFTYVWNSQQNFHSPMAVLGSPITLPQHLISRWKMNIFQILWVDKMYHLPGVLYQLKIPSWYMWGFNFGHDLSQKRFYKCLYSSREWFRHGRWQMAKEDGSMGDGFLPKLLVLKSRPSPLSTISNTTPMHIRVQWHLLGLHW